MTTDRLGLALPQPATLPGWSLSTLVHPAALAGANGMRWGPSGELFVAQAFGSQLSAVDVATGKARVVSPADGKIVAPDDLAFDSHGNMFVTEVMSARVSALRPNGRIDVIAADVPVANGITVHGDRIFMSEFNPEGRIWELYADGSAPRLIASGLMMPNALCLGPDNHLYFPLVPLGEIWRVSLDNGTPERVIGGLNIPTAVKFDAQGRLFTVESGTGAITLVDLAKGTGSLFSQVAFGTDNLAFAPDGRLFVSHFTDGEVVEIAPDGTQRIAVAGGMTGPFGLAAGRNGDLLVADGMSFAVVDRDGTVTRPAMLLQHGFPGYVRGVAAGHGDSVILTNSAGQLVRYVAGGEAQVLLDGLDQAMKPIVADDGTVVVCEAGAGRVLAVDADGTARVIASGLARPTGLAQAPDGGFFVSEAGAGTLRHIGSDGAVSDILSGLIEPHGVAVSGGTALVLDRGTGTLIRAEPDGTATAIATGLPAGTHGELRPNVLPGIKDLMPGPLLPFSDIAVLADGRIAVGGDETGAIVTLSVE